MSDDWGWDGGYQYYERENDVYSGQYHDEPDDPFDDCWCECDACTKERDDLERQLIGEENKVENEWIELEEDYDPFCDCDMPERDKRYIFWNVNGYPVVFKYTDKINPSHGYTYWMECPDAPEKKVELLNFNKVLEGSKNNKQYRRSKWIHSIKWPYHNVTLNYKDVTAEDWVEVE